MTPSYAILRGYFLTTKDNIMKKIMIAAVAATMASVSMADISITGDAYIAYADNGIAATAATAENTKNAKRVNINFKGKSGATTVVASARGDDQDVDTRTSKLSLHQFYITTKVGPVDIKAGDFYGTIGLGAFSKGDKKTDALMLSTKIGPAKVGIYTHDSAGVTGSTNIFASTKVAGTTVKLQHNAHSAKGWTNLMVKGTFNGISVAAENHDSKENKDVTLIHVGGKAAGINWDIAQLKNDEKGTGLSGNNNTKLAPLGSMLIGKGARGGTATAAANAGQFSKILGLAVKTKLAGNTVKAIFTKNTLFAGAVVAGAAEDKVTGMELILTRPLSGGMLTANLGKVSGANTDNKALNSTNKGLRFDVKF